MGYNTYLKFAGDTVTVKRYKLGIASGFKKNSDEETKKRAKKAYTEEEKKRRFLHSCKRAERKIYDLIASNVGKHKACDGKRHRVKFLTVTLRSEVYGDISLANKRLADYFKRLSFALYGVNVNDFEYVTVPELQKRGVWHFHIVVFNMPYIPATRERALKDVENKKLKADYDCSLNLLDILNKSVTGGVWINALPVKDVHAVASYVIKYIQKGIVAEGETDGKNKLVDYETYLKFNMQNKRRYYPTRNLLAPEEYRIGVNQQVSNAIIKLIAKGFKKYKHKGKEMDNYYFKVLESDYVGEFWVCIARLYKSVIARIKEMAGLDELFGMMFREFEAMDYTWLSDYFESLKPKYIYEQMRFEVGTVFSFL